MRTPRLYGSGFTALLMFVAVCYPMSSLILVPWIAVRLVRLPGRIRREKAARAELVAKIEMYRYAKAMQQW